MMEQKTQKAEGHVNGTASAGAEKSQGQGAEASAAISRRQSRHDGTSTITSTYSAAAAFGEDIADDAYSVSELSQYNEERRGRHAHGSKVKKDKGGGGGGGGGRLFGAKMKLPQLRRQESGSQGTAEEDEHRRIRNNSSGSPEPSDDLSGDSGEDSSVVAVTHFASFAKLRFQGQTPHTYSCSALQHPLLPMQDRADYLASLTAWVTLLRIMGDMPDMDVGDILVVVGSTMPVSTRIRSGFALKPTKKDVEDFHKKYSELFKDPIGTDTKSMAFLSGCVDTMLEKIQLICGLGIHRAGLRDELYCQICKQLSNNPSRNSSARGWVLMSLMVASFAPSEKFAPCLATFLREGPMEFCPKVDRLLRRTCNVGTRGYPPSWLEFQASKNGKPLLVPVTFMNGHRMLCELDGATTVGGVITGICQRLGIQDITGYSLFIVLHTKISCLGSSQHRVMDAVSECEQYSRQLGMRESSADWRLFLRREYFSPWHNASLDPVCTDLVYQQIKRGIAMGEYPIEKEEILLKICAQTYYSEYPDDFEYTNLPSFVNVFIPEAVHERRPEGYFTEKVKVEVDHILSAPDSSPPTIINMKEKIVNFAMDEFAVVFSRFYDVTKVTFQSQQMTAVVVGINSKGIIIIDNNEKMKIALEFCEIVDISRTSSQITLTVVDRDEMELKTHHAEDFYWLVTSFIQGLKERSIVSLASHDFTQLDGPTDANLVKGDILELLRPLGKTPDLNQIVKVNCRRTNKRIDVPSNLLYLLPAIKMPKAEVLTQLSTLIRKGDSVMYRREKTSTTLHQFAKLKFRSSGDSTMTKLFHKASFKKNRNSGECLWQYSKDSLKRPLLKRTCAREDIRKQACHSFNSIQTYMANLGINDESANYNLCFDWILEPARRNRYIRDEIYCQVIKQLTNNPDKANENRGWILLTLLTSITRPGHDVFDQCMASVQASNHSMAPRCVQNLLNRKGPEASRLFSSHFLEYQMVIKQHSNLRIQVAFPNQSIQMVEVTSQTRVCDIKRELGARVGLKSFEEYGLFLINMDKVNCLHEKTFYFDSISHAQNFWLRANKRQSAQVSKESPPLLVMMKKIWVNGAPGVDPVADTVFHFSQELSNFLRGYYEITSKMTATLSACLYRIEIGTNSDKLEKFSEIASQIAPKSFLQGRSVQEAQELVKKEFEAVKSLSPDNAKKAFIEELCQLVTYGAVFFEVKQQHSHTIPRRCLIAINFSGVHIIDASSKAIVKSYEFYCIPNWAYDDVSFTFIFTDGNATSKLLVETTVGHNIDDLLMSYIAWIMNFQMRRKYGYIGNTAGESIC